VTLLVRADGQVVVLGRDKSLPNSGRPRIPALPESLKYTAAEFGDGYALLSRSDGLVIAATWWSPKESDSSAKAQRFRRAINVPRPPKGSVLAGVEIFDAGGIERIQYWERKLGSEDFAHSSISSVKAKGKVRKGKAAKVKVVVASQSDMAGAKVRIAYKGKTIGTAKVSKSGGATVRIKTGSFKAGSKNKVTAYFLGNDRTFSSEKTTAIRVAPA
jgi:hypothetical protein